MQFPYTGSTKILPSSWNWDSAPCFPSRTSDLSGKSSHILSLFNLNFIFGCKDNFILLHWYRDGVMLVIGYSLLSYHMKKLAGMMGKCGLSHLRCVRKFFQKRNIYTFDAIFLLHYFPSLCIGTCPGQVTGIIQSMSYFNVHSLLFFVMFFHYEHWTKLKGFINFLN